MGKLTGFMEYERVERPERRISERIKDYKEFHTPLSETEQKKQAARCMNCGVPSCQWGQLLEGKVIGCPLNNLVPEFNDALYHDENDLALQRLLKTNPFPEFTGRVCPALCEKACTCGLNEDPVSIRDNEYAIIERAFAEGKMKPLLQSVRSRKKIAVIGSGPSGLSAADWLNKRGHQVSVYEAADRFGGLLMYGIPNMKLDKEVISRRISLMKKEGVSFLANHAITTVQQADELQNQYDAVILACGSRSPRKLALEMPAKGAYYAVDYLTQVTADLLNHVTNPIAEHKHAVIIGGGDTGNDCVASCLRQHCASVTQLEIMPEPPEERTADNPWPEWPNVKKTDYGQAEAIEVFGVDPRRYKTTVKAIQCDESGAVQSLTIVKTERQRNEQGRMVFVNQPGSEEEIPCDLLLVAMGFAGCTKEIAEAFDLSLQNGKVAAEGHHVKDHLFTAGDMHIGQSLVVLAIKEGLDCAEAVDQYLIG